MTNSINVEGESFRDYIGDGVYASFDGYNIWLRTERGDGMVHEIALEPNVLLQLDHYRERLSNHIKELNERNRNEKPTESGV